MKGNIQPDSTKAGEKRFKCYIDLPSEQGQRNRKTRTFKSEEEAEQWLIRMNYMLGEDLYFEPSEMPLEEYLDIWLDRKRDQLANTSIENYENSISVINGHLGALPISKITPFHVQTFFEEELKRVSSTTVRLYGRVLRSALKQAVDHQMIEENPTDVVDLPKRNDVEMKYLTRAESRRFLSVCEGHWPYQGFFHVAIRTGMRLREMLGLKWKDIDFEARSIAVRRQVDATSDELEFVPPKTKKSRRKIRFYESLNQQLKQHRSIQLQKRMEAEEWPYPDLVFVGEEGRPLQPNTIRYHMRKLLEEADCERIRIHDLRHTCATLLLGAKVNPEVVRERLGHKNVSVTLNRYSHVVPDMQKEAAKRMDEALE